MLPPQGAVPQQQVHGGIPANPQTPRGSAPQAPSQGAGKSDPKQIDILRHSPRIKQALELYLGRPVEMSQVPPEILTEVAGMVAKLGVEGAVAMAQKMLPHDIQQKLKESSVNGQ